MRARVGVVSLLVGLAGGVQAQPAPSDEALNWMRLRVAEHIQRPPFLWTYEQVDSLVRPLFLAASRDGRRITRENREFAARSATAQSRSGMMQQFLSADVKGEGRIDRAMLRLQLTQSMVNRPTAGTAQTETVVETYFRDADADGDGFVTYEEAVRAVDRQVTVRNASGSPATVPAGLDLDGDDIVTIEEFGAVVRTVYDEVDADRDGRISQPEATHFQSDTIQRVQRETQARLLRLRVVADAKTKAAGCAIPVWEADTILTAVLAGGERAMADLAIGGGTEVIGAVNVQVDTGDRKISVVLQSPKPVLWQFSGDVGRVAAVFVAQHDAPSRAVTYGPNDQVIASRAGLEQRPGSGVTGIPSDRVTFASRPGCLPMGSEGKGADLRDQLAAALGREPNAIAGPAVMTTARIPSGATLDDAVFPNLVGVPHDSPGGPLWAMLSFSRRALLHVDASAVTAALPVRSAPLPGVAGLAAMVDDGRARISAWQTVTRFMGPNGQVGPTIIGGGPGTQVVGPPGLMSVARLPSEILILAPVTLPAGLRSSDLGRLVVAKGIPAPSGDRSTICIVREEDGQPVDGSRCR